MTALVPTIRGTNYGVHRRTGSTCSMDYTKHVGEEKAYLTVGDPGYFVRLEGISICRIPLAYSHSLQLHTRSHRRRKPSHRMPRQGRPPRSPRP